MNRSAAGAATVLRAAAIGLFALGCASGTVRARDPEAAPLARLTLTAKGASEAARANAERNLTIALIRDTKCPLRLLGPDDGDARPELEIEVVLTLWREKQEPGGELVYDPATNREKRGILHTIEARYDVHVRVPGEEQPRVSKQFKTRTSGKTERVQIDPVLRARREMANEVAEDVSRLVCRALRR